jgi:type I restriction enzyme R subunit
MLFEEYDADYFDLVIVDECHRGSARDNSAWRRILDHFHGESIAFRSTAATC